MIDIFPFPRISANTTEGQIAQLVDYLVQFKETLEFALMNISTDNLSSDLIAKLNDLGADIEKSKEERVENFAQVSNNALTVSDVCNSDVFKMAVQNELTETKTKVDGLEAKFNELETQLKNKGVI